MDKEKKVEQDPAGEAEKSTPTDAAVDKWVDAHLRNSAFSRDTEAWNHFQSVLPALRDSLRGTK